MGTVTKLNDVLCANISKVDDILKANASKWDDNSFCPSGPTPTPTPTPTVTPTPTPCPPGCCYVELCYNPDEPKEACDCNTIVGVYLHLPCVDLDCNLSNATGIYDNDTCDSAAAPGYYQDGSGAVYYWDGNTSLSFDSNCK